jgi:hypothetical protein
MSKDMSNDWIDFRVNVDPVPVGDVLIIARYENGREDTSKASDFFWGDCDEYTIVSYKIVEEAEQEPQSAYKDTMKIYCDNFLALTKALNAAGGDATSILSHNHEFLETLARNRIEVDAKYIKEHI